MLERVFEAERSGLHGLARSSAGRVLAAFTSANQVLRLFSGWICNSYVLDAKTAQIYRVPWLAQFHLFAFSLLL